MSTSGLQQRVEEGATLPLGMALCAAIFGLAIVVNQGQYSPLALVLLTIGGIFCIAAVAFHLGQSTEESLRARFGAILAGIAIVSTAISTGILLYLYKNDRSMCIAVLIFAALALLLVIDIRGMWLPALVALVVAFCVISALSFISPQRAKDPHIDVFVFQQNAADALRHGQNPYAIRFPNIYEAKNSTAFANPNRFGPGTPFYGPGVVDSNGWITYGFPYPPLSLLMVMPGFLLGGDCRFVYALAVGLSGILMATARRGRWGALAALLLLVSTTAFYVVDMAWTEPLLIFTFSLVMFCACRWRKGLPWALGLFLATKQYSVLLLPAVFLLMDGPNPFKQLAKTVAKAGLVAALFTLPLFAWNPHEFIRSTVQWQLVQPYRADALSYLAWIYNFTGGHKAPIWTPFLIVIPAIIVAIWRCARTPAGFAAGVTLIYFVFFAFNKQAFCNYYFFVIGTALWSVAATPAIDNEKELDNSDEALNANVEKPNKFLRLGLPVLGALAIGFCLMMLSGYIPTAYEKTRASVLELGVGFVTGAVIAVTIEYYMRTRKEIEDKAWEKKVQDNIFKALFGTALSTDLVEEMYQSLFTRKFVRQKLVILINLRPLTAEEQTTPLTPGLLVLTQTVTYDAKNISDQTASHHVSPQEYALVSHPMFPHPFDTFSVTCGTDKIVLSKPSIKDSVTTSKDGIWHHLNAPKINVPEGAVVEVVSKIEMLCRDSDIKTWLTYHPAERLTLTVKLDDALVGKLDLAVDQSHRLPLKPDVSNEPPDKRKIYGWKIEKPILPNQGVILYWRRKPGT